MENLAYKIKGLRVSLGLTLEEFGELINNSNKSNVLRWERGKAIPRPKNLLRIAQLAGMDSIDEFLNSNNNFHHILIKMQELEKLQREYMQNNRMMIPTKESSRKPLSMFYTNDIPLENLFASDANLMLRGYSLTRKDKEHLLTLIETALHFRK